MISCPFWCLSELLQVLRSGSTPPNLFCLFCFQQSPGIFCMWSLGNALRQDKTETSLLDGSLKSMNIERIFESSPFLSREKLGLISQLCCTELERGALALCAYESKLLSLFSVVPRQLEYAESHQHFKTDNTEASASVIPLKSWYVEEYSIFSLPRKKLGFGFLASLFCTELEGGSMTSECVLLHNITFASQKLPTLDPFLSVLRSGQTENSPSGSPQKSELWTYVSIFSFPPQGEAGSWQYFLTGALLGGEIIARGCHKFPSGFNVTDSSSPSVQKPLTDLCISHKGSQSWYCIGVSMGRKRI